MSVNDDGTDLGSYAERHGEEPRDDDLITAEDIASARHCEIKIDGLPGQLPAGRYAMTFEGMEYRAGANRPVLRFRYTGKLADVAFTPGEVETGWPGKPDGSPQDRDVAEEIRQADGPDIAMVRTAAGNYYRTRSGRIITDEMIEGWAAEAEAGYDPDKLRASAARTADILQGAAYRSAQRLSRDIEREDLQERLSRGETTPTEAQAEVEGWLLPPRDHTSPPQPPQVPDLFQVSQVEVLNVSKVARVIAEMIRSRMITARSVGLVLDNDESWNDQIERWLRS